jgi:HEAT repeat protein
MPQAQTPLPLVYETDPKYGTVEQIMALPQNKLIAICTDPQASVYAKAKAAQRLAIVGDATAVPSLAPLLADEKLSTYDRGALETIPAAAASAALRASLKTLKGNLLIGVIHSLAARRDTAAIPDLAILLRSTETPVVMAASAALGRIRPHL